MFIHLLLFGVSMPRFGPSLAAYHKVPFVLVPTKELFNNTFYSAPADKVSLEKLVIIQFVNKVPACDGNQNLYYNSR